jgi:hypothetical protein
MEDTGRAWRRQCNEELRNLYASPNIIRVTKSRRTRWEGHVAHMEEMRNADKNFVRKTEGKRPCGRSGRKWEDNIKMELRRIGRGDLN